MPEQAGSAYIPVRPDLSGFHKTIGRELQKVIPDAVKIGDEIGKSLGEGIKKGIGDPLDPVTNDAPKKGAKAGGSFAKSFKARVEAALKALPDVKLGADATDAERTIQRVRIQLEELSKKTIGVDVKADAALGELEALKSELASIDESATIDVRANAAAAMAQLAALQAEVAKIDGETAHVSVDADTGAATTKLSLFDTELLGSTLASKAASLQIVALGAAIAGLATIIQPALASMTGLVGAIGASFGAAGLAAGAFGVVTAAAVKRISDTIKKANKLQQQAQGATGKTRKKYLAEAKTLMATLTPAELHLADALQRVKDAWIGLQGKVAPDIFKALDPWLRVVTQGMRLLVPLIRPAAKAIQMLGGDALIALGSPFWQRFFRTIGQFGGKALEGLGVAFGHIAKALAELFLAFQPLGQQFVAWLVQVTARFATWAATFAKSKAFTDFIAYVKSSGALFLSTLLAIGKGLWAIVHALAPFAGPLLKGIRGLFNLFASFPPTAFKALAVGIIAVIAIFGVLVVAVAAAVTAVVATLGLVIYVIARVVTAVISLVRHWRVAWNAVKKALSAVWHWMRGVFNTMKRWFPRTWRTIWTAVTRFFRAAWRAIRGALRAAWRWMKHTFHTISHWVTRTWRRLWNSVKHLFQAAWRAIRRIAGAIWRGLRSTFNTIRRGITSVWRRAWNTVTSVARRAWHSITSGVHRLWGGLRSAFRSGVNAIKSIWNRLKRVAKRPVNFIIGTVYNRGIRGLWNKVAGWVGLDNLKLGRVPLLASGDVVPASGTATAAARAIVGEGSNTHPEYVIPTDPKYRDRALDLYSSLGTRLMADGGILGGLKSFGSHVVGLFTHPVSTLENLLSGVLGKLDQIRTSPFGRAAAKIPGMIVEKLADKLKNSVGSFLGGFGAAASGPAVAIGRRMAAAMGWVGSQWNALKALWTRESSWNPYAVNPKSGAYGIPQSLGHGHPFALGDAVAQIRWGIGYILGRYTNPVNAWQHEVAYGWYDQGGLLPPGASVVYNGTGQSETVLNSRQLRSLTAGGTLRIEVAGPEEMRRLIRRIVRVDGHGNVQEAFG